MKTIVKTGLFVVAASLGSHAYADEMQDGWKFGIGTGISALSVKGDLGFNSLLINGPVEVSMNLSPHEIQDSMKTAFGFGGFAAKDEWKINYQLKYLELEGDANGTTPGGVPISASSDFKMSGATVTGTYLFSKSRQAVWGGLAGLRYTKHKFSNSLTIGGSSGANNFSHSWTDVLIGLTNNYFFSMEWSWNTQVDAGFGGSKGTYHINTGPAWRFAKSWVGSVTVDYTANNFENGNRGDPDWYLYKGREASGGIGVMYLF
jgi:hypothetical protein